MLLMSNYKSCIPNIDNYISARLTEKILRVTYRVIDRKKHDRLAAERNAGQKN